MMSVGIAAMAQSEIGAWICDSDPITNVRSAPKGAVVMALPDTCSYMLGLSSPSNGWWKIDWMEAAEQGEEINLKGSPTGEYWIHHSVVGLSTRNYGGQRCCLRATPSKKGKAVCWFTEELMVNPMETKDDWVKVKAEVNGVAQVGWIEGANLCDNPLTTCP